MASVKIATIFALLTVASVGADNEVHPDRLVRANNEFSFDLYRKVGSSDPGSNVILSPSSILIGLGMLHAGAREKTRSQLAKGMHLDGFNGDETAIGEAFKSLISVMTNPDSNHTLRTANRIYARDDYQIKEEFLRTTADYFRAKLEKLNFVRDPSGSKKKINKWVSDQTEQKIQDLLPDGSITPTTVMVLVNAIYFRGFWTHSFSKNLTKRKPFHLTGVKQIEVEMMARDDPADLNYYDSQELGCRVLELTYIGRAVSMFVFLPHEIGGLPGVEGRLGADSLQQVFRNVSKTMVKVVMPKFKLDQGVSLKPFLTSLGIQDIFDRSTADLSGIDGSKRLYVSEAVHKAYVAVDEEGTVAAASTGFVIRAKSGGWRPTPVDFIVDRPFLFAIVEKGSGSVLFLGRVRDPPSRAPPPTESIEFQVLGGRYGEQRYGDGSERNNNAASATSLLGIGFPALGLLVFLLSKY